LLYVSIKTAPDGSGGYTNHWLQDEVGSSAKFEDNKYYGEYSNNVGSDKATARTGMSFIASSNVNNWTYKVI